jgi:glycosyltransferase involved in cell wall biosynthesis
VNILTIVAYAPTPIRVRPYSLIRALRRRGHAITLATVWETPFEREALASLAAEGIHVASARLTRARAAWNALRALPSRTPLQARYSWQPELARRIDDVIQTGNLDIVHVEHLRGSCYGLHSQAALKRIGRKTPVVWDSVDCISYLFAQANQRSRSAFGKLVSRLELSRTRRYEGWLVGQFDRALVTSQADLSALAELAQPAAAQRMAVLPNGVDLPPLAPDADDVITSPDGGRSGAIIITGKMSYHANVTAARYLVEQVMPLVWHKRPAARVVVAGSNPPAVLRQMAQADPSRIEVTGYVQDMRVRLQQAAVATAPIIYGAGIQNKVLEAMACGRPVVATPHAVQAIESAGLAGCLVAGDPQAFADAIVRLLDDPALRRQIGAAGRRYVEERHNWDVIAGQLEDIYRACIAP